MSDVKKIKDWFQQNKLSLGAILFSLVMAISFQPSPKADLNPKSMDTFIPPGQVLIPIRVQNFESLDQILGKFGVVDLYTTSPNGSAHLVVKSIKILRSPVDPQSLAVLAPEDAAHEIVKWEGPFQVVIQPPSHSNPVFAEKKLTQPPQLVEYDQ